MELLKLIRRSLQGYKVYIACAAFFLVSLINLINGDMTFAKVLQEPSLIFALLEDGDVLGAIGAAGFAAHRATLAKMAKGK